MKGFGIIEIIVAMAIFLVIASSLVTGTLQSSVGNRLGDEQSRAMFLSSEAIEAVHSIRNRSWSNLTPGSFGIGISANQWVFIGTTDVSSKYVRQIIISNAYRSSGNIVDIGGTLDPDTFKVSTTVSWNFSSGRNNSVGTTEYLTNFKKLISSKWSNPVINYSLDISGNDDGGSVDFYNNYLYLTRNVANKTNFYIINIASSTPTISSSLAIGNLPGKIKVVYPYAFVPTNNSSGELVIIDVSNPSSPTIVNTLNAAGSSKGVAVDVVGNYAYLLQTNRLTIINISNKTSPAIIGTIALQTNATQLAVIGSNAYITSTNDTAELQIININNPASPSLVKNFDITGTADALSIKPLNNYLFIGQNDGSVKTLDITNPSNPTLAANYSTGVFSNLNSLFINNNYLFLATSSSAGQFKILDISNPISLQPVGSLITPGTLNDLIYIPTSDKVYAASTANSSELIIFSSP